MASVADVSSVATTVARAQGHFLSPVRPESTIREHQRHSRARTELPARVVDWSPEDVGRWLDGLGLHG
jgi:transposase